MTTTISGDTGASQVQDGSITTADLQNGAVTVAKLNPTAIPSIMNAQGSAPMFACRAWCNFNAMPLSGTYAQSGTLITITMTAHGMSAGQIVNLDFTTGTAVDGSFAVTSVVDANTFTVTAGAALTTSGNVTRNLFIRASGNVSSVTDNGVGDYTINFTTAMSDANYSLVALGTADSGGLIAASKESTTPRTPSSVRIVTVNSSATAQDSILVSASIFR